MDAEDVDVTVRAAELHDLGKVGVPDAILDKPSALDAGEWEFMRQHTILGERILNAAPALRPVGEDRPRDARALGRHRLPGRARRRADPAERPHRRGLRRVRGHGHRSRRTARSIGHVEACRELRREAGRQFDPIVVEAFLAELEASAGAEETTAGAQGLRGASPRRGDRALARAAHPPSQRSGRRLSPHRALTGGVLRPHLAAVLREPDRLVRDHGRGHGRGQREGHQRVHLGVRPGSAPGRPARRSGAGG